MNKQSSSRLLFITALALLIFGCHKSKFVSSTLLPVCPGMTCGHRGERQIIIRPPANFDPQSPSAEIFVYTPKTGTSVPWLNRSTLPDGKKLDVDLETIWGKQAAATKPFTVITISLNPSGKYYFDPANAISAPSGTVLEDLFFRGEYIMQFSVKIVTPSAGAWYDYDLYVTDKSNPGKAIKVDPKIKNGGYL